jgi:hypothetical protein
MRLNNIYLLSELRQSFEFTRENVSSSKAVKDFVWLILKGHIRALALRVLAEFLRCHADRFGEYIELTIVRTLEAHKDPVKEVNFVALLCNLMDL